MRAVRGWRRSRGVARLRAVERRSLRRAPSVQRFRFGHVSFRKCATDWSLDVVCRDCVTYLESSNARARARVSAAFPEHLSRSWPNIRETGNSRDPLCTLSKREPYVAVCWTQVALEGGAAVPYLGERGSHSVAAACLARLRVQPTDLEFSLVFVRVVETGVWARGYDESVLESLRRPSRVRWNSPS